MVRLAHQFVAKRARARFRVSMAQGCQAADGPELIFAKDCRAWRARRGTLRGQRDEGFGSLDGYNIILDGGGEGGDTVGGPRQRGRERKVNRKRGERKMSRRRDREV